MFEFHFSLTLSVLSVYPRSKQATGSFNLGKIQEFKPIGFPQDGGELEPYSVMFYWAYAFSDEGGLIDKHPHKGFEIMSYVVKGEIQHYDNQLNGWKRLKAGDAQIIRAGDGIVHAEKLMADSAMFQIWFDPNLNKSLSVPASYNDYSSDSFPVTEQSGVKVKHIKGNTSPFMMNSNVDFIQEWEITGRARTWDLDERSVYSAYLMEGSLKADGSELNSGDFMIIKDQSSVNLDPGSRSAKLFLIRVPADPGFQTYYEYMRN